MKCEVKHNGDAGMGHLWHLSHNWYNIYGLNGWGQLWQVAVLFGNMLKKCWPSGEYPFRSLHDHWF